MAVRVRLVRAVPLSLVAVVLMVCGAAVPVSAAPHGPASRLPGTLHLQTVPTMRGVVVKVDGRTARSDAAGRISIRVRNFVDLGSRLVIESTQVSRDRRVVFDRFRGSVDSGVHGKVVELGLRTVRLVSWRFVDRFGAAVPVHRVAALRLRSNTGEILELAGAELARPHWVAESRTQQGPRGMVSKRLYYVVDTAMVDGTSVVNRAGQRFVPWEQQAWVVQLLFFKVSFTATDMFFPRRAGDGIRLTRADGTVQRLPFAPDGAVLVPDLPRGTYTVTVTGGGMSFGRPVSISKDQQVTLTVISAVDLVLVAVAVLLVAMGLVLVGRPYLRGRLRRGAGSVAGWLGDPRRRQRYWHPTGPRTEPEPVDEAGIPTGRSARDRAAVRRHRAGALVIALLAALAAIPPTTRPAYAQAGSRQAAPSASAAPVPVLAYYYIWFSPTSWNRAKTDYPLLGRYSSDDVEIMRRHVRMAKTAGIHGFLVSWKHTRQLDERLAKLVEVARGENFRLGIVYQGLDFSRNPLPLDTVRTDLSFFATRYATDPVFDVFGKPVVIWNGSDRFTAAQIGGTVGQARRDLLILGNAKSLESVESSQAVLDGQAYYWSSADPVNDKNGTKLAALSRAVHLRGGLWIAPVAPGFDARLVGGERAVPRRGGATLRASFTAARRSQPDAIGVISWNEFSENTHVEPSERFGSVDIEVLADLLGTGVDLDLPVDSSEPAGRLRWRPATWSPLLLAGAALVLLPLVVALRRRRARLAGPHSGQPPVQRLGEPSVDL